MRAGARQERPAVSSEIRLPSRHSRTVRDFEARRAAAEDRWKNLRETMDRQAAVNRALGLGRVPLIGARIMRALDRFGMLGAGIRILGTNAIYGYEASSGVRIDPGLTATEDIDLLLDARGGLAFFADPDVSESSLMKVLQRVDASFERSRQTFRAVNRDGYLVDLIKPMQNPPWREARDKVGSDPEDLSAVEIEGLDWLQNAPAFEAIAIDERGEPTRIIAADPRVWAAHKLWLSRRADREPLRRQRDAAQAEAVAALVTNYLTHLPFDAEQLRMLPKDVVAQAAPLFAQKSG
jgi:hypothetical protein